MNKNTVKEHNKKLIKIIKYAQNLLMKKEGWIKGAEARTKDGQTCSPLSPDACKFCAVGALKRAVKDVHGTYDFGLFVDVSEKIKDDMKAKASVFSIESYNDSVAKDKRYILRAFNRVLNTFKK